MISKRTKIDESKRNTSDNRARVASEVRRCGARWNRSLVSMARARIRKSA